MKTVLFFTESFPSCDHHQTGDIKRKCLALIILSGKYRNPKHNYCVIRIKGGSYTWSPNSREHTTYTWAPLHLLTFSQVTSRLELLPSSSFTVESRLGYQCLEQGGDSPWSSPFTHPEVTIATSPGSPRPSQEHLPFFKFLRSGEQPHGSLRAG